MGLVDHRTIFNLHRSFMALYRNHIFIKNYPSTFIPRKSNPISIMHTKRIILIISACIISALLFLNALPMRRTYKAIITVNANNTITNRTIADTANWNTWYINPEHKINTFLKFENSPEKKYDNFYYTIQNNKDFKNGLIQLSLTNKWNTEITWIEEFEIHDGLLNKLKLLFSPSQFREPFFENIVKFKNHIEHPDSIFGGITFERMEIPTNNIVVKNDTIAIGDMENTLIKSYNEIITAIPENLIKEPGAFLSQYEKISDSLIVLDVAVEITEPNQELKIPFEITELESHEAVIMRTTKGYTDIDTDISIMYEWLKKII